MKTETIQIVSPEEFRAHVDAIVAGEGSQYAAAVKMGAMPSALSDYLRGRKLFPRRIAEYFGLRVERVLVKVRDEETYTHAGANLQGAMDESGVPMEAANL